MPYTATVTCLDTEGGASLTIPVTARLWMLWTVVGGGSGPEHRQDEQESQNLQLPIAFGDPVTISFQRTADFSNVSRSAGISIQDTNRVPIDEGWLFRSGEFPAAVPERPLEIIAGRIEIPAADLPGLLPAAPITVDPETTITDFTATLADGPPGGIDFSATGTTRKTGVIVGFRYSGRMVFTPSSDVAAAASEALQVGISNPSIVFLSGPSLLSAVEAELLNLLRLFIMRDNGPAIARTLERRVNAAVIASAGRSLPGGELPAGVILSVRSVSVNSQRILVRGSMGAFDGVIAKLPAPPSGGGGTRACPGQTLITLGHAITGMAALRELRDGRLAATETGRRLIEAYYRCAEEVSELLRADARLARRAAALASELAAALGSGAPVPDTLRFRVESFARELAAAGSPQLRASVALALDAGPWRLL